MQPGIKSPSSSSINHRSPIRPLIPTKFPPEPLLIPPKREQPPASPSRFVSAGCFGTAPSSTNLIRWKGMPRTRLPQIAVADPGDASAFGDASLAAILVTRQPLPEKLQEARSHWRIGPTKEIGGDEILQQILEDYRAKPKLDYSDDGHDQLDEVSPVLETMDMLANITASDIIRPAAVKEEPKLSFVDMLAAPPSEGDESEQIPREDGPVDVCEHDLESFDGPRDGFGGRLKFPNKLKMDILRAPSNSSSKEGSRERLLGSEEDGSVRRHRSAKDIKDRFKRNFGGGKKSREELRMEEARDFIASGRRDANPPSDTSETTFEEAVEPRPRRDSREEKLAVGRFLFGDRPSLLRNDPRRVSLAVGPRDLPFVRDADRDEDTIRPIRRVGTLPTQGLPDGIRYKSITSTRKRSIVGPAASTRSDKPKKPSISDGSEGPAGVSHSSFREKAGAELSGILRHAAEDRLQKQLLEIDAARLSPEEARGRRRRSVSRSNDQLRVRSSREERAALRSKLSLDVPAFNLADHSSTADQNRLAKVLFKDEFWHEADSSHANAYSAHSPTSYRDVFGASFWEKADQQVPVPGWKKAGEPLEKWLETLPGGGNGIESIVGDVVDVEDVRRELEAVPAIRKDSLTRTGALSAVSESPEEMAAQLAELERSWREGAEEVGRAMGRMALVVDGLVVREHEEGQRRRRAEEMGWGAA